MAKRSLETLGKLLVKDLRDPAIRQFDLLAKAHCRARPLRTTHGGPTCSISVGCTARTCSISSIEARQISHCAFRQLRIVHLCSRSSSVPDSSKRTASAFGST